MIEACGRLRLSNETSLVLGVFDGVRGQELQGHGAFELCIHGFVDNAHSPLTEFLDDLVVGDGLAANSIRAPRSRTLGQLCCRPGDSLFDRVPRLLVPLEKRFHGATEFLVGSAFFVEEMLPRVTFQFEGGRGGVLDALPAFGVQAGILFRVLLFSQALASLHSLRTVISASPRA